MQFKTSAGSTGVTIGGTTYTPAANGIITVADASVTNSLVTSFISLGILPYFAADTGSSGGSVISGTVSDSQSAPIGSVTVMSAGQNYPAGRALAYVCTAPGTLSMTLANSGSLSIPIPVSTSIVIMPFAVTSISFSNGLTGSFWNMG